MGGPARRGCSGTWTAEATPKPLSAIRPRTAAVLAPLLSIVMLAGTSCRSIARSKKRCAAATSRWEVHRLAASTVSSSVLLLLPPRSRALPSGNQGPSPFLGTCLRLARRPVHGRRLRSQVAIDLFVWRNARRLERSPPPRNERFRLALRTSLLGRSRNADDRSFSCRRRLTGFRSLARLRLDLGAGYRIR